MLTALRQKDSWGSDYGGGELKFGGEDCGRDNAYLDPFRYWRFEGGLRLASCLQRK